MTAAEVMAFLKEHENPNGKELLARHGAREPFFGARIGDMKPLVKKIKKDHELALELYATGNSDAMYFAGLIADADRVTKDDLRRWVSAAYWYLLSESTVAGVAADSPHGWELGLEWIESDQEMIADAGWATLGGWLSVTPDDTVPFAPEYIQKIEARGAIGKKKKTARC